MKFLKKQKGFTLIELLVVVAIIGILATVVLSSLSEARSRTRDAKRLADIKTIQTTLEVYYLDNGSYPTTSWRGSHTPNWATFGVLIGTTLPVDPLNTADNVSDSAATVDGNYIYSYFAHPGAAYCSGNAYMLVFNLENKNGDGVKDGVKLCPASYGYSNSFVVGVNGDGKFKTPDMSGTLKE
jgi:type II secretion system protein G